MEVRLFGAGMVRKVYEVDPMHCPKCRSRMKAIAFITGYLELDTIIHHLKLMFVARDRRLRASRNFLLIP